MCIFVHNVVCTAHKKLYSITVGKYNRLNNSASWFLFFVNKTIRCIFFVIFLQKDNTDGDKNWPQYFYQPALICPRMTLCFLYQDVLKGETSRDCGSQSLTVGGRQNKPLTELKTRERKRKKRKKKKKRNKRVNRLLTCRTKECETFSLKDV